MTGKSGVASQVAAVARVSSGNFVEMYDFMVYGYYAKYIGDAFFPSHNAYASLMLSLATFGSGYLMRPLGAVLLGSFVDRHGRRIGLLVTLGLMAFGTLTIAVTPGYAQIGVAAPLIVLIGRLVQGLSAGVELGGVSIYLAEIAPPGKRGLYCCWQSASQQVAVMVAALIGVGLSLFMPPAAVGAWGWRLPLILGCLIIPLIFYFRSSLTETEAFQRQARYAPRELLVKLAGSWQAVLAGMILTVLTTTAFYLITAYTPTYGREVLKLSPTESMLTTLAVGVSNFFWLPIGGMLSDRFGRKPLLLAVPIVTILTVYPVMSWLVASPSFGKLVATEIWTSTLFGLYNGAMIPRLAEIVPARLRITAFALGYSLANAVFGGFTPAIATYLIHTTGNRAAPAVWLTFAAAISLIGVLWSNRMGEDNAKAYEITAPDAEPQPG